MPHKSLNSIKMVIFYRVSWEHLCAIECSRSIISFNPPYEFTSTKHKIAMRVIQHDVYAKSAQNTRFFFSIATTVKLKYYCFKWRVLHMLISFHNKFLLSVSTCNRKFCLYRRGKCENINFKYERTEAVCTTIVSQTTVGRCTNVNVIDHYI